MRWVGSLSVGWEAVVAEEASSPHPSALAALLAVQGRVGYVPAEALVAIEAQLGVPKAELFGVLGFYSDLRTQPPGRHVLRVCLGDSCYARQSPKVLAAAQKALGCQSGQTDKRGAVTLGTVYCLGNCARSPSVELDGEVIGDVSPAKLTKVLGGLK